MDSEIAIYGEKDPRFRKKGSLAGSTTSNYILEHQPQYGLIVNEPDVLVMVGRAYDTFNPSSMPDMQGVKKGDIIETYCDNTTDIYQRWNPPEIYQIQDNYMRNFEVRLVVQDRKGLPVILATSLI